MDYEQKYKDALERAKNLHKDAIDMGENIRAKQCEIIFPELAESEDEKMREELIRSFKSLNTIEIWNGIKRSDILAWLEKQGQKPYGQRKECLDCQFNYAGECKGSCAIKRGEQKSALDIEIPFGAKDSELQEATYLIPEGFHAEIKDDEVLIKKGKQKPTKWSEEDEEAIGMAIIALGDMYDEDEPNTTYGGYNLPFNKAAERLKSLKQRIGG